MKTLLILLLFFSLVFTMKFTNEDKKVEPRTKEDVKLMFTQMYEHSLNTF